MLKKVTVFLTIALNITPLYGKIAPPNYNFSIDSLKVFYPNSRVSEINAIYGKGLLIETTQQTTIYKFNVTHAHYTIPIFVQSRGNIITDFFARLPSYFLHDKFHQDIISRLGQQNKYIKQHNAASYIWANFNASSFYYGASCTITCFPMYFAATANNPTQEIGDYHPILTRLQIALPQVN